MSPNLKVRLLLQTIFGWNLKVYKLITTLDIWRVQ